MHPDHQITIQRGKAEKIPPRDTQSGYSTYVDDATIFHVDVHYKEFCRGKESRMNIGDFW